MGVALTTGLVLGVMSALLEFKMYSSMPFLRKLTDKSLFCGLAISLGLSWAMGMMFSATGLTVLIGAVSSTMMTEPIHAIIRRMHSANAKATFIKDARDTYHPLWKAIKVTVIIVAAPLWIPVKVHQWRARRA